MLIHTETAASSAYRCARVCVLCVTCYTVVVEECLPLVEQFGDETDPLARQALTYM